MWITAWRIATQAEYPAEDLSGAGAAKSGGRWNRTGEAVIYASMSIALAAWETRAHIGRTRALPFNRLLVKVSIPLNVWSKRLDVRALTGVAPSQHVGWDVMPAGKVSWDIGAMWLASNASALLVVPSVIVPEEKNIVINPTHADAGAIKATKVRTFRYDPRV